MCRHTLERTLYENSQSGKKQRNLFFGFCATGIKKGTDAVKQGISGRDGIVGVDDEEDDDDDDDDAGENDDDEDTG